MPCICNLCSQIFIAVNCKIVKYNYLSISSSSSDKLVKIDALDTWFTICTEVLMTRINCKLIVKITVTIYTGSAWERSYRFIHLYNKCLIHDKWKWKTKRNDEFKQRTLIMHVYSWKACVLNNWKSTIIGLYQMLPGYTPIQNHLHLPIIRNYSLVSDIVNTETKHIRALIKQKN